MEQKLNAVVLAGGYATRFWPITKNRPKVLLPIDSEQTVIDKLISELSDDDRISQVYVSTNERFSGEVVNHVSSQDYETPTVSVEQTTGESGKLGVIGALNRFVKREGIQNENLMIVGGDNVMSISLSDAIDSYEEHQEPVTVAYDLGNKEDASSYGVIETDSDGAVTSFVEKPENPNSSLISVACYLLPREHVRFQEYLDMGNNPDEPGSYMSWLLDDAEIQTYQFEGRWYDIGTPDTYLEAVNWWMGNESYVSETASINGCEIGDGCIIEDGVEIEKSSIHASVVLQNTTLDNVRLQNTIVDSEMHAENLRTDGSVLGNWSDSNDSSR